MARRRTQDFSPVPPGQNPLTSRNYTEMNQAQTLINEAERKMERMCAAGVNCDQYQAQLAYLREAFAKLKEVYFPDRA